MFSFIKWFGNYFENIKKNKGLWFTFLTTISLIGIFVSLYFVNFLVSDVAKKTYENQTKHYILEFKDELNQQIVSNRLIASILSKDETIGNLIFDQNSSSKLKQKLSSIESLLNSELGKSIVSVDLEKYNKQEKKIGVDISKKGAVILASLPMAKKDENIINIEVKRDITSIVDFYKKEQKDFLFFLTQNSINKIDRDYKKSHYQNFGDKYFIDSSKFNPNFLGSFKSTKLPKEMKDSGYIKGAKYFYVYKKVYDIRGDLAGFAVVGEEISGNNSFVNLVKNLVNSVTLVALGLIISMILFLF